MQKKLRAAILGATGVAGQQFLLALARHPWFTAQVLAASERSAGKTYREALGPLGWCSAESPPAEAMDLTVVDAAGLASRAGTDFDVVFSALESDAAKAIEPTLAAHVPVFSTASAYRYEPDVPILVPGVNPEHAELLRLQQRRRGWRGFIAPGPNCTATGLVICLRPLHDAFGLSRVIMTSLQAVSGAGRSPGVLALDILDNVIPYIAKEEEKVEIETRKILGRCHVPPSAGATGEAAIEPLPLLLSCTCTRVPVLDGHTEAVYIATERPAPLPAVKEALLRMGESLRGLDLPSLPAQMIAVREELNRPQPRLDRDTGGGMTTVVGRLRAETALGEHGVKFVLLSHNTRMGAAGGSVLTAEWLLRQGFVGG
ncbi:aspartate-semialdehyde dehydrogenase [Haliangium sp. UPWRP_2]|uniref:aspartate-semialdehyde dehydrogenase n=1 Tax=Haliangium sp. UPWRP_2 TaxID=1931276 RepID=UPI000D0E20FE|nr:aspartate-semialdehyde dehydrogenase [Haliangium sp. UPWRP_2]PSM31218.1 aspartate-semialdehyde dehydrogenase [Haliangium sp. UPWRP_2]